LEVSLAVAAAAVLAASVAEASVVEAPAEAGRTGCGFRVGRCELQIPIYNSLILFNSHIRIGNAQKSLLCFYAQ
jgi:hypothetical protein